MRDLKLPPSGHHKNKYTLKTLVTNMMPGVMTYSDWEGWCFEHSVS